ncbi:MAG: adenine deaminase C-terminal domain-containing protein, partial [Actinomycetota bacterium]
GLMSDRPLAAVAAGLEDVLRAAAAIGITLPAPFMALSFLGLSVIPDLRITDQGLIDVNAFATASVAAP